MLRIYGHALLLHSVLKTFEETVSAYLSQFFSYVVIESI